MQKCILSILGAILQTKRTVGYIYIVDDSCTIIYLAVFLCKGLVRTVSAWEYIAPGIVLTTHVKSMRSITQSNLSSQSHFKSYFRID